MFEMLTCCLDGWCWLVLAGAGEDSSKKMRVVIVWLPCLHPVVNQEHTKQTVRRNSDILRGDIKSQEDKVSQVSRASKASQYRVRVRVRVKDATPGTSHSTHS